MALLNFTTAVPASRTVGQVQEILAEAGASQIAIKYHRETRRPSAVEFMIDTPFGERWYTLPANAEPVLTTLAQQKANRGRRGTYINATPEQAERVAWRIIKDWIEAQLAIIETGMASFHQVMLPYMHANANGLTVFEAMIASALPSLPAPKKRVTRTRLST